MVAVEHEDGTCRCSDFRIRFDKKSVGFHGGPCAGCDPNSPRARVLVALHPSKPARHHKRWEGRQRRPGPRYCPAEHVHVRERPRGLLLPPRQADRGASNADSDADADAYPDSDSDSDDVKGRERIDGGPALGPGARRPVLRRGAVVPVRAGRGRGGDLETV